ncbi:MAG: hypothetical protein IJD71_01270 [Clostridia bacterium]|nr:hypothetical protein [Clostridia bacterium]
MLKKLVSFTVAVLLIFSCMSIVVSADSAIADIEPNDDIDKAQVIEPNASVSGVLAAPDLDADEPYMDIDVYKFTLKERSKITFTCSSNSITLIPTITDELGETALVPDIDLEMEELPDEYVIKEYLAKGTYYVVLLDIFTEDETAYSFTMACESAVETLKYEKGVWKYYVGGKFAPETTLVKYKGTWFYVENGVWNKNATTLVKYEDQWFYVKSGKWTSKPTTLVKHKNKWFYIKNGKWASDAKTLVKYKGKWFYVKSGKWNKTTTIVKYSGKKFYVKDGIAQLSFSGKKKIGGQTYIIKKGKVV